MLLQTLRRIFSVILKAAVWLVMAGAAIPYFILVLFLNLFPDFTHAADPWFWAAFIPLNIIAYYFLWKPILWTIKVITTLGEET